MQLLLTTLKLKIFHIIVLHQELGCYGNKRIAMQFLPFGNWEWDNILHKKFKMNFQSETSIKEFDVLLKSILLKKSTTVNLTVLLSFRILVKVISISTSTKSLREKLQNQNSLLFNIVHRWKNEMPNWNLHLRYLLQDASCTWHYINGKWKRMRSVD